MEAQSLRVRDLIQSQPPIQLLGYPTIFHRQLRGAAVYSEVYFKDATTGQWVETDSVIALSDVLLVIEAKAGVMAMHSPATDFDRHERVIRELIIKACEQCKRFLDYLGSAPEVPLYARVDNQFVEVARLRRSSYRLILPIGLTVESFTPFSAMCKDFPALRLSFSSEGKIVDAACSSFLSPTVIQANYPDLLREAERQKTRLKTIGKPRRE